MSRPFVVVQVSDMHIGADWAPADPVAGLSAVVASVREMRPAPDALLLTGDLADHAADHEYALLVSLLEAVDAPRYALPGNHDGRDALRRHFGPPGAADTPVQYAVELGPLRVLMLDSTRAGADSGELDAERLAWLDEALAADARTPTVLAMHHPPFLTHAAAFDALGLPESDRTPLAAVVRRHPNVSLIVAGHVHRPLSGELGGCRVLSAPSTYAGFALDLASDRLSSVATPPGYVVHAFRDGELVSHVQSVPASP
jgi:3',5'-cyclic AMP phosphodiesterase CpdA